MLRKVAFLLTTILATVITTAVAFAANPSLEAAIINGVKSNNETIDVSSFNVDPQEAVNTYLQLKMTEPALFCVDNKVDCTYSGSTAKSLKLKYTVDKSKLNSMRTEMDKKVEQIANLAKDAKDDVEKARIVHDYLTSNVKYDVTMNSSSVYDVLMNNKGICTSYAHTYKLVMDKLNIPCGLSTSVAMAHQWNTIKVNGNWYNVDVTYDVTGGGGSNFLKSDNFFKVVGHSNWVNSNGAICTDTKFDSIFS